MDKFDYDRMIASLDNLRDAIMRKELTDVGWDLRDEVLALHEVVAALVQVVYEQGVKP